MDRATDYIPNSSDSFASVRSNSRVHLDHLKTEPRWAYFERTYVIQYKHSTEIYEIYKPRLTVGFLNDVISSANSRPYGNCGGYSKVILEVVLTVAYFKFLSWSDILRSYNDVLKMVIVILT